MSRTDAVSPVDQFVASLPAIDVTWDRTDPDDLAPTLADRLTEPAVGVPIPIEGVTLPDAVETDPDPTVVRSAATGVTPACLGIADYGSVVLASDGAGSEQMSLYPETHIAVLDAADVVPSMAAAVGELGPELRDERGDVVVATGPSATSDMGALVRGVHGPRDVHVLIVEQ